MSGENVISFEAFAENHRKLKSATTQQPRQQAFSSEWKRVSLEILIIYQEVERKKRGRSKFKWMATRDAIMADYDDASGNKILARDSGLSYSQLYDWYRHGSIPDTAFRFVDRFVRSLAMTEEYEHIYPIAKRARDEKHANALSEIYQTRQLNAEVADYIFQVSGEYLFTDDILDAFYDSIIFRFDFVISGVIKLTIAYCRFDVKRESPQTYDDTIFYEGYMFVIPFSTLSDRKLEAYELEGWNCWIKLIRPRNRGSWQNGCADGLISYSVLDRKMDTSVLDIRIDFPNNILAPRSPADCVDERFISGIKNGKTTRVTTPNLQRGKELSVSFDKIFDLAYFGYLF
ncbi:hypothetical protein [Roseobacter sp. MH60115]|uniref:hypothetical protein n=1 Tax=Roseobacter sp. MH60115 TaxID=2785324 RepID=UPI0018A27AF8|nr:hypothetical protein [Roseobacter sp. MH60115]